MSSYNADMDAHRIGEERSLAYHRAVAERLASEPATLSRARAKVARWLGDRSVHPEYAEAWRALLVGPLDALVHAMTSTSERACAMRSSTPFAGALPPTERWRIWREVFEAHRP